MNMINVAYQNEGQVTWASAGVNKAIDIRRHIGFGFTFKADSDILADAVFEIRAAPPSDADQCVEGIFHDIEEVFTCSASWGAVPATKSFVTVPAGVKKGGICTATLPCKPDAFVKVFPVSGDTGKIEIVVTLSGRR
jgi:hypothetical protein